MRSTIPSTRLLSASRYRLILVALLLSCTIDMSLRAGESIVPDWRFVSVPDFLNRDTTFPQPGFEEGLGTFLHSIREEDPEFVLVAGDLIDGHWPSKFRPTREAIISSAAKYYTAWKERMQHFGLKYYATIGDHEVGDNPWPREKAELVPLFKEEFTRHLHFPLNGPEGFRGTSYYVRHRQALIIALDVFTAGSGDQGEIVADVKGGHLAWVEDVLGAHQDATFKIVMGHTPILGPVKKLHSSGMMFQGGEESALWKIMKKHNVDLYLCGEVHAVTCTERDGINQIAHGSLFGWNPTVNYLLVEVSGHTLSATLKEIECVPVRKDGRSVGMIITGEAKAAGFRTVGTLAISKLGGTAVLKRSGCFTGDAK